MVDKKKDGFILVDQIKSEAYLKGMVSCLICERDLFAIDLNIDEPSDPMESWAANFSESANLAGWVVSETGSILCSECKD